MEIHASRLSYTPNWHGGAETNVERCGIPEVDASVLPGYQRPLKRPISAHHSISPSNKLNYFQESFVQS